jgi:hypothetical protein
LNPEAVQPLKIPNVVSDDELGAARQGEFENQIVFRIWQARPPKEMNPAFDASKKSPISCAV